MRRGEIYRVRRPPADPKSVRAYVVVSRQSLVDSTFSTVICAPILSARHGLPTQVPVGAAEGLKHDSAIHCDGLVSLDKSRLTNFLGSLSPAKLAEVDAALARALGLRAPNGA